MVEIPLRKNDEFFTIAHISDLHFESSTVFPPDLGNVHLEKLIADVGYYSPDILCVTGDIAENPWSEALRISNIRRLGSKTEFSQWNSSLLLTFRKSLAFLYHACRQWSIEPSTGLFVIPGNHDYRIQGTYGGFLGKKLQGVQALKGAEFREVFGSHFRNSTIASKDNRGQWPIVIKIVCLDSNDTDAFMNFATGAVSTEELKKLEYFEDQESPEFLQLIGNFIEFRACLVHHHPLPVVPAEVLRDKMGKAGFQNTLRQAWEIITGEQTNLFKNGGSFLFMALEGKVDLVMHGHQHRSWFSNIQYPGESEKRLLVAGAASAGKLTGSCYRYCIYRLDTNGNIKVIERSTENNPIKYTDRKNFSLYKYDEVRSIRREKLMAQLNGFTIPELKSEYGVATADEVTRVTKIRDDGNAHIIVTWKNLRASRGPVAELHLRSVSTSGYRGYEFPPKVVIESDPSSYYRPVHWKIISSDVGEDLGCLVFDPPLRSDRPLSIKLEYLFCNAFEFVQEYRRALSTPTVDSEFITYSSRSTYVARFNQVIMFPRELSPPANPTVHVYNPSGGLDEYEREHCAATLNPVLKEGIILLSINHPLPGYRYEISWPLFGLKEYNDATFSTEGLQEYEKVSGVEPTPELRNTLLTELKSLRDEFSKLFEEQTQALMDASTELTLLGPISTTSVVVSQKAVDTRLKVFSSLNPLSGIPSSGTREFRPGMGIAGQAFRSRQTILFKTKAGLSADLYLKFPEQKNVHSVLFCVPLPVRAVAIPPKEAIFSKDPVYAILCIGSFNPNSGLNQIVPGTASWYILDDYVRGAFNQRVFKILTDAKVRSII
jgi:3',5'-cyclic AMP phosphodiesterase CpdA